MGKYINNKKGRINWNSFFIMIGILFPVLLIVAFAIGSSTGENSWGYVISHNYISCIVVGILFLIAILCAIKESKKEKLLKESERIEES